MGSLALVLVLGSAGVHATWNLAAKRSGGGVTFAFLYTLFAALVTVPCALGLAAVAGIGPGAAGFAFMAGSGVLHALYFAALQWAYRRGDLSVVYPLARGTGPAVAIAVSVTLLGERVNAVGSSGGIVIVVGVFALAASAARRARGTGLRGVLPALAVGLLIASYTLWDSHAIAVLHQNPLVYYGGTLTVQSVCLGGVAMVVERSIARCIALWRDARRDIVTIGVASPLSYVLVLWAFALAPVAYVAPGREVGIVLGALLGNRVLGEPDAGRRIAASALIVTGVILLGLA